MLQKNGQNWPDDARINVTTIKDFVLDRMWLSGVEESVSTALWPALIAIHLQSASNFKLTLHCTGQSPK